ncbi:MAG: septal ring lytic transglycosylase RlpA family protein [Methylococcaceae bacterium]|nr:septal ring lytic transglycosylase RlpA family protein [Methylococcaceae bacterium]
MNTKSCLGCLVFLLVVNGCQKEEATKGSEKQTSESTKGGVVKQQGQASWYGPGFHGNTTANGETYNQNSMTAASTTLLLGTTAKVTSVETGKSVTVKVNDRGPYVGNRVMDLSKAAANKIGIKEKGVGKVKIVAHKPAKKHKYKRKHK